MQPSSLLCYLQRVSFPPAAVRVFMRASFPRVFAGCDSNEEQSNGQNQTQVGHVFAVCADLSTCQVVKLWLFISISYRHIGCSQQLRTLGVRATRRLNPSARQSRTFVGRKG